MIMFKNKPPICDIFGNPHIWWDKFWSVSSPEKFLILWKSQEKMLSMLSMYMDSKWKKKKRQAQVWAKLEVNSWRKMVSVLHWGVMLQIHHMIQKIWWWGVIAYGLNSPNDLYLEAKNQNMGRYGGYIYSVTLSYDI